MTDETDDEVLTRYRHRDPHISPRQALALNTLKNRYAPLLVAARNKLEERRDSDRKALRQKLFGRY